MLKKQNRLLRITKKSKGSFYSSPFFNIKIYDGEEKSTRFGFVVSKKVSSKAVVRNRTKRVLRAAVEEFLEKIKKEKDIIIFSKTQLETSQSEEVFKSLSEIFTKAKII